MSGGGGGAQEICQHHKSASAHQRDAGMQGILLPFNSTSPQNNVVRGCVHKICF